MAAGTLKILEVSIKKELLRQFADKNLDEAEFGRIISAIFDRVKEYCEASTIASHKAKAAEVLPDLRKEGRGFEDRNFERWKPSFDHLEMMWCVARELGEMHGKDIKAGEGKDNNSVMAALAHIFPRALLVTQEIICLLKGGFPDGALARWRSLHELNVTAMYIAKHGEAVAVQYLLSFYFAARRAAKQMNEYAERAQIYKFSDEERKEFDVCCQRAEEILGRKIEKDRDGE